MTSDYKTALAVIEVLAEQYPQCFSVFERRRKPLKIGIHNDVLAALDGAITVKECAAAMRVYCGNAFYLKACIENAARIDLDGNAVGTVTAGEADNAKQRLEQQQARRKRRRDALVEARAKAQAEAKAKARNSGRVSLADLRKAAQARRATTRAA